MTRGLRNNNPGNIRFSGTIWQGEIKSTDKSFKQFRTIGYGYRALIKLLQNYQILYGCKTVPHFISRWAPPRENNTSAYIQKVCSEMQIPTTQVIDVKDKATMIALASAISRVENGIPAVKKDVEEGWALL